MSADNSDLHNPPPPPAPSALRWTTLFVAVFLGVLAGIAGWFLLLRLFPVLVMALAGFALAYLLDPLLNRLEARHWPRGRAVGLVAVFFVLLLAVGPSLTALLVEQVKSVADDWPNQSAAAIDWVDNKLLPDLEQRFPGQKDQIEAYRAEFVGQANDRLAAELPDAARYASAELLNSARLFGYTFLTMFIALWAMVAIEPFRRRFALLFSEREVDAIRKVDRKVTYMLGQYLRGMFLTCLGIALTDALLLQIPAAVFGTRFSFLLAAMAGIAYLVPYAGMATTVVVTGVLSGVTVNAANAAAAASAGLGAPAPVHSVWLAVVVSVGIIVLINQLFDTLVMPRIVGRKVGLHPLVIVLALLAGGALAGIWGMILATPLAATVKIILAQWVPVIATVPDVPEEKQPLVLDLGGFAAHTWGAVRGAERKVEGHLITHRREKDDEPAK